MPVFVSVQPRNVRFIIPILCARRCGDSRKMFFTGYPKVANLFDDKFAKIVKESRVDVAV